MNIRIAITVNYNFQCNWIQLQLEIQILQLQNIRKGTWNTPLFHADKKFLSDNWIKGAVGLRYDSEMESRVPIRV